MNLKSCKNLGYKCDTTTLIGGDTIFNIYDKNETNFTTNGLAKLTDVNNPSIRQKINAEYSLTFEYPLTEDDDRVMFLGSGTTSWRISFTRTTNIGKTLDMRLTAIGRWK